MKLIKFIMMLIHYDCDQFFKEPGYNTKLYSLKNAEYKFRLTGIPFDKSFKLIKLKPYYSVAELKPLVKKEYKINPKLGIQFLFKGEVLLNNSILSDIGIRPLDDILTIMAVLTGG